MEDPIIEEDKTQRAVKVVGGWEFLEPEEGYFESGKKYPQYPDFDQGDAKDTFQYTIFDDEKDATAVFNG